MIDVADAIYDTLRADADLTDLVGDRIAHGRARKNWGDSFPYVVYNFIGGVKDNVFKAGPGDPVGRLERPMVQVSAYSKTSEPTEACDVFEAFDGVLDNGTLNYPDDGKFSGIAVTRFTSPRLIPLDQVWHMSADYELIAARKES